MGLLNVTLTKPQHCQIQRDSKGGTVGEGKVSQWCGFGEKKEGKGLRKNFTYGVKDSMVSVNRVVEIFFLTWSFEREKPQCVLH